MVFIYHKKQGFSILKGLTFGSVIDILQFSNSLDGQGKPAKGWKEGMTERDPIDVIREQLGKVDGLAGGHPEHDLFLSWHSETKAVLEKIFSSRSIHYQSFVALRFREVSAKGFASPEIDKINAGRYRRDLESVKNVLQGAIKELTLDRTLFKRIQTTPKTVDVALKGEYFICSGILDPEMNQAIEKAFEGSGLTPVCTLEARGKGLPLRDRIEQIKRARFGIYDVSGTGKDDVLLELGAAIGQGKEIFLLRKKGSTLPAAVRDFHSVEYEDAADLSERLKKIVK